MNFSKKISSVLLIILACSVLLATHVANAAVVDKVMAVVNDEVVTQREFDRTFYPIQKSYEERFKGVELQEQLEQARKGLLEQIINSKLAISLAKKEKVKVNEEELKKRMDAIRSYYGSEDEFLRTLDAKGTTLSEYKKEMKDQLLAQKLVEREVSSRVVISPTEVQDLYIKNKEKLIAPDRIKVRGIMIRKSANNEGENLSKKIKEIASEIKKGKSFAVAATEYSEGPYAKNGGDMGYVSPGQIIPEIDEVIFKLKKGKVSDIVETKLGYHIFVVEDIQKEHAMEFNEVSDFLREQLFMKKFEEGMGKWIDEKRKNAYIAYK